MWISRMKPAQAKDAQEKASPFFVGKLVRRRKVSHSSASVFGVGIISDLFVNHEGVKFCKILGWSGPIVWDPTIVLLMGELEEVE